MDSKLAIAYLGALVVLLAGVIWLVIRQIIKARSLENVISDLQPKLQKEKGTPEDYYQLGSVYLRKKLYAQAITLFNKAIKEGGDNMAEVYNALGFAYFSQEQYDLAIKNYKEDLNYSLELIMQPKNYYKLIVLSPSSKEIIHSSIGQGYLISSSSLPVFYYSFLIHDW